VIKKTLLLSLVFIWVGSATMAQETLQEQFGDDLEFPALPYFGYGSGLGITAPDSTFRLNLRFRIQNRATYTSDGNTDAVEAAVRRLRLRFDGFVGDPRFLYAIQLSFAPGDVGELSPGDNINIIRDAVFFYRPNRNWNFSFGQTKLPGNRQRINSSGALQLTDRSINNARFSIDRDFGIQAYYLQEDVDRFSYNVKTAVSTGDGRNWTRNPSLDLAYTTKFEMYPFGAFQRDGTMFEGDLVREQTPKLMLSGVYHFNKGAQRTRGQLGQELAERRDLTSVLLDAMLKYRGWSVQTAYLTRRTHNPGVWGADGSLLNIYAGTGMDFQLSHLFQNNFELIGRYSFQNINPETTIQIEKSEQYSVGITRYIWEHALKLQAEATYNEEQTRILNEPERSSWYVRFQVEIGI